MKLLDKSIRSYLIYSAIILIVAIPVFYLVVQQIVIEDVDESLAAQKEQVIFQIESVLEKDSNFGALIGPNVTVTELSSFQPLDSTYQIGVFDTISHENVVYQVLESNVRIKNRSFNIQLKSSLIDSDDLIRNLVLVMVVLLALIITGLLLINRNLSKKIWKPFYATLRTLSGYRIESDKRLNLPGTNISEFTDLNDSLNTLTQRNYRVYLSQKEFAENASHEMQTPLAIFQSKLELLMQTTPLSEEQASLISELSQTGQRMSRLYKTLLLLAKIDNNQFPEKEKVSVREILEKMLSQFEDAILAKSIGMEMDISDYSVESNPTLMEMMISNLLSNAIRHNKPRGKIRIRLQHGQLEIANEGSDTELDIERLFQRFQKQAGSSRMGLGLEIVKKICDLNEFEISYSYENPFHNFKVRLS